MSSLKISRILHAGYVFQSDQTVIAFDPIFENPFSHNCFAFPEVKFDHEKIKETRFDAVFISHYHDDHCSLESLNFLPRSTPIYIFCIFPEMISLIQELGFTNVFSLELNAPVLIGSFEVIPRQALDADVDCLFHIRSKGINVLNVVDSWIDESTLQILKQSTWDLILWPFQTMREIEVIAPRRSLPAENELPLEWINQLRQLKPKYIVPSSCQFIHESWSWYNHAFFPITYKQFEKEMNGRLPEIKVVRLNPSNSFLIDHNGISESTPLPWVIPQGDQNVDYDYQPDLIPPTTQSLAMHFLKLSMVQVDLVDSYCKNGLVEKYNSLQSSADDYFQNQVLWSLKTYDHDGGQKHYLYQINDGQMIRVERSDKPVQWLTEVPESKIFAVLELGESLTSMYIRINDMNFEPDIEKVIGTVDIIEDPLIRSLFTGVFGAYQKAQLKRIKNRKY